VLFIRNPTIGQQYANIFGLLPATVLRAVSRIFQSTTLSTRPRLENRLQSPAGTVKGPVSKHHIIALRVVQSGASYYLTKTVDIFFWICSLHIAFVKRLPTRAIIQNVEATR